MADQNDERIAELWVVIASCEGEALVHLCTSAEGRDKQTISEIWSDPQDADPDEAKSILEKLGGDNFINFEDGWISWKKVPTDQLTARIAALEQELEHWIGIASDRGAERDELKKRVGELKKERDANSRDAKLWSDRWNTVQQQLDAAKSTLSISAAHIDTLTQQRDQAIAENAALRASLDAERANSARLERALGMALKGCRWDEIEAALATPPPVEREQ